MYLQSLQIERFRAFRHSDVSFRHPGAAASGKLKYPNINLLLGNNGMGKSAALKAASLALMSPVLAATGYRPYWLVRREVDKSPMDAAIKAHVALSAQDREGDGSPAPDTPVLTARMEGGYPWLAHDCLNYLVSCKTCNEDNKKTCFPVGGPRGTERDNVHQLNQSERPFLVDPVGTDDVPPEELVGFLSFVAVPRGTQRHERRRGRVIIDLFGLNLRDELAVERCRLITAMWPYLERQRTGVQQERNEAAQELDQLTRSSSQHANCARCFQSLYDTDRAAARRCYEAARTRSEQLLA